MKRLLAAYNKNLDPPSKSQRWLVYSIHRHSLVSFSPRVGGFADRLKGVCTCFLVAIVTNRRFAVHWDAPFSLQQNLKPKDYDWRIEELSGFITGELEIKHLDFIDNIKRFTNVPVERLDDDLIGSEKVVVMNCNSYAADGFINFFARRVQHRLGYTSLFRDCCEFLFQFEEKQAFVKERDSLRKLQLANGGSGLIAVHLRTGGEKNWGDPDLDSWKNYKQILDFAFSTASKMEKVKKPNFLFLSDSQKAREAVAKESWNYNVHVNPQEVVHLDRSDNVAELSNDLVLHDFQMISECDAIICGKGGFASTAGLYAGKSVVRYRD